MILACIQGKTLYPRRFQPKDMDNYSVEFSTERKRTQEDELTSIVFGTLRYLSPAFVARVATMILRQSGLPGLADGGWISGTVSLWERREGTEPDVILRLVNQNKDTFTLVVEVKWFAGEGESQLEREWKWLTPAERRLAAVVFLSKKRTDYTEESRAPRSQSLGFLTWLQFAAMLRVMALQTNQEMESYWLYDQIAFLSKIGLASFEGFDRVRRIGGDVVAVEDAQSVLYEGFGGFQSLRAAPDFCSTLIFPTFARNA